MTNTIRKQIELRAPVSRVWRALTDHREFGEWFRVKLDGPFVAGQVSRGHITYPGYEHVQWEAVVQKIEPERLFSYTWHPYAIDPKVDYSTEPHDARRVPAREDGERHAADDHRIGLREAPGRPAPRSRRSA